MDGYGVKAHALAPDLMEFKALALAPDLIELDILVGLNVLKISSNQCVSMILMNFSKCVE